MTCERIWHAGHHGSGENSAQRAFHGIIPAGELSTGGSLFTVMDSPARFYRRDSKRTDEATDAAARKAFKQPLGGNPSVEPSAQVSEVKRAFELHQSGRLDEAEALYRATLVRDAHNFNALHLLGALCAQTGRLAEAATCLSEPLWCRSTVLRRSTIAAFS